jgi:murein DD-endopeptidase MepM/ murein hydrolase activator NlpD
MALLLSSLLLALGGVWPLQPQPAVVRPFAPPAQRWEAGHRGVDLAGSRGQPVHTALAGTVSFVGSIAGVRVVVVDHGRRRTTYQPVAATVRRGEHVAAGQEIGTLLWFGSHCLPRACLHWGLIEGRDHYLDPLTLVGCGPQPVRLLPLWQDAPRRATCDTASPTGAATSLRELRAAIVTLVDVLAGRPAAGGLW